MRYYLSFRFPLRLLLLALPSLGLQAQSIPKAEADSLLRLLQGSKADTNRVNLWIRLGEYQVYKPGEFKADVDSARSYARQAQDLSRRLKYYRGEARSFNLRGTISREAREFEQSVAYHQAALRLYRQRGDWNGEADCYLRLAWARRDKGDAAGARQEVQQAIALYTKKGYPQGVAQAYLELGNTYANWDEGLNTKIGYYGQALGWFARARDKKKQADVHKDLGDLYTIQGNDARALIELHKALALYQSIRHPQLQGVYDLLGHISSGIGDYQEGLRYGLLAVKTAESLKDSSLQLCTIYNRLGITYYNLKQNPKALFYFNQAMRVAQKYNDQPSILILTTNIVSVLSRLGQWEGANRLLLSTARRYPPQNIRDSILFNTRLIHNYTQLKQYALAQGCCNQLLSFSYRLGKHHTDRIYIYSGIIPFYIASKQHRQAKEYLVEYEEYCKTNNNLKEMSQVQLFWFRLDSMQANYPSAIRHYQQYKRLEDSLLNETKNRQVANMEVLYETKKKEQDLALKEQNIKVLNREKQLQAKQIEQDRLVRNAWVGGAGLLLLLVGVLYNRYRLKQRSNQQLQAQQLQLQAKQAEVEDKNHLLEAKQLLLEAKQAEVEDKNQLLEGLLGQKEELVEQKEWLLKEVHHRVKNNLQIIISLLQSQGRYLSDEVALNAINQSKHRVRAMALIHQKLYRSDNLSTIDVPEYLREVVEQLAESFGATDRIGLHYELEPLELDVVQAVPLGLILNEAVTNTLKYAFPQGRTGTVRLSLRHLEGQHYELVVEDDGVGLPSGLALERSHSMGAKIMRGLSKQLEGTLRVESQGGVRVTVTFQVSPLLLPARLQHRELPNQPEGVHQPVGVHQPEEVHQMVHAS